MDAPETAPVPAPAPAPADAPVEKVDDPKALARKVTELVREKRNLSERYKALERTSRETVAALAVRDAVIADRSLRDLTRDDLGTLTAKLLEEPSLDLSDASGVGKRVGDMAREILSARPRRAAPVPPTSSRRDPMAPSETKAPATFAEIASKGPAFAADFAERYPQQYQELRAAHFRALQSPTARTVVPQ